jgi:hypothetical protein
MGGMSLWHWMVLFIVFVLPNLPAPWVMRRAGISGWWWLLFIIPFVNVVWLYVFAFREWPRLKQVG